MRSSNVIVLLLSDHGITGRRIDFRIASVEVPEDHSIEDASKNVSKGDRNHAPVYEFSDAEARTVEHTDGNQVEVGDGMLVTEDHESPPVNCQLIVPTK